MFSSRKYNIGPLANFIIGNYPEVANEIRMLGKRIQYLPDYFKPEIVISFLKDHKVNMDWVHANSVLVALITSRAMRISHTEHLFESSKGNKVFQQSLEDHITDQIGKAAVAESMIKMHRPKSVKRATLPGDDIIDGGKI
jgi:hypothetical protein